MSAEMSVPLLLLTAYIWILLLGGLTALIIDLRTDARGDRMTLPAWNLSWLDFGIGFWVLLIAIYMSQSLVVFGLEFFDVPDDDTSLDALILGTTFHGVSLLLIIGALQRSNVTKQMKLSPVRLRLGEMVKPILLFFFSGIFLAMIFGKIWESVLVFLESLNLGPSAEPQDLVTIFSEGGFGITSVLLMVLAVIIAPITEELIFRAGIYRFLKGRFTPIFALIISSFVFALMHMNALSFLPLFLLGMLLCRSYERTGNILVPISFHALFNANNIFLLLFQVEAEPLLEEMTTGVISRALAFIG